MKEDRDNISTGGSVNGGNTHENAAGGANQPSSTPNNPESNDEIIKRVRAGWTANNANAVTIGELYLMVNEKLELIPLFGLLYSVEFPCVSTMILPFLTIITSLDQILKLRWSIGGKRSKAVQMKKFYQLHHLS